ncbi:uncharacterized protein F4812DRAFT_455291 [Daldinia caldariorum]|uniref:uncharacterized protein n=1 Tax=Daldinia caldariorum TaxID=326644 RepID=UPI002008223A|nr:uncharacterized protein F4812DRAFT_455291 [Daldinia caldariorum]KAI1471180.1 hypothetical protein F4812DRAFT_455291 [Daldinia caldariorum]
MDAAYKQHANQARRKNRSSTNLQHLSLAPLTSKFPLTDPEDLPDFSAAPFHYNVSYLQGKSAPTTPRLLQSPSRTRANSPSRRRRSSMHDPLGATNLPKSKSTTHLVASHAKRPGLGASPPLPQSYGPSSSKERDDDWILRTGALISARMRESKGQAWLAERASSTSLTGMRDVEEEAYERELARERELASRRSSRRGSIASGDDDIVSPSSRFGSRSQSRAASGARLVRTPVERHTPHDGYFGHEVPSEDYIPGPDFVGLDEKLEAIEADTSKSDEAAVRKLVYSKNNGLGSWVWSLFSVEENDEESDEDDGEVSDGETEGSHLPRGASTANFERISDAPEERIPPPKSDEGGWRDAAWLLTVASKVLL